MPNIYLLPPSDFKDLIMSLQQLEFFYDNLLNRMHLPQILNTPQKRLVRQARWLQKEYANIGTHYGWVLASDYVLLERMFLPADIDINVCPRMWMKNLCERYEETERGLQVLVRSLKRSSKNDVV